MSEYTKAPPLHNSLDFHSFFATHHHWVAATASHPNAKTTMNSNRANSTHHHQQQLRRTLPHRWSSASAASPRETNISIEKALGKVDNILLAKNKEEINKKTLIRSTSTKATPKRSSSATKLSNWLGKFSLSGGSVVGDDAKSLASKSIATTQTSSRSPRSLSRRYSLTRFIKNHDDQDFNEYSNTEFSEFSDDDEASVVLEVPMAPTSSSSSPSLEDDLATEIDIALNCILATLDDDVATVSKGGKKEKKEKKKKKSSKNDKSESKKEKNKKSKTRRDESSATSKRSTSDDCTVHSTRQEPMTAINPTETRQEEKSSAPLHRRAQRRGSTGMMQLAAASSAILSSITGTSSREASCAETNVARADDNEPEQEIIVFLCQQQIFEVKPQARLAWVLSECGTRQHMEIQFY